MPGVTYTKRVQFTPHGPVVLNVITAPKPGGLYSLAPVLSNETIVGREKLTEMQKRLGATATTVGVNGDLLQRQRRPPERRPRPQRRARASAGAGPHERRHRRRRHAARRTASTMLGFWRGTGQRLRVGAERPAERERLRALHARVRSDDACRADGASELVLPAVPDGHAEHRPRRQS